MNRRLSHITIIGLGKIGGSLAAALGCSGGHYEVTGFDASGDTAAAALDAGIIQTAAGDIESACAHADIVVLATPVLAVLDLLPRVAAATPVGAVIVDTAGAKGDVVSAMNRAPAQALFYGGHPIAGNDRTGREAWDAELFADRAFALVRTDRSTPSGDDVVQALCRTIGARPVFMTADQHDTIIALSSHLPTLIAVAYAGTCADGAAAAALRDLAGGQFAAVTRMADSPPEMIADVIFANNAEIARAYDAMDAEVRRILSAPKDVLMETVARAGDFRRRVIRK